MKNADKSQVIGTVTIVEIWIFACLALAVASGLGIALCSLFGVEAQAAHAVLRGLIFASFGFAALPVILCATFSLMGTFVIYLIIIIGVSLLPTSILDPLMHVALLVAIGCFAAAAMPLAITTLGCVIDHRLRGSKYFGPALRHRDDIRQILDARHNVQVGYSQLIGAQEDTGAVDRQLKLSEIAARVRAGRHANGIFEVKPASV